MALRRSGGVRRRTAAALTGVCLATIAAAGCSNDDPAPDLQSAVDLEAVDLAATVDDAYSFTYPLYELARHRWNALETADGTTSTTLNTFAHSRSLAGPDDTWANAPSLDVLYSTAWLDLAAGPVHLDTPDTGDRFSVLTLIDFYSNTFFYAGERTTGTQAQRYFVVAPDWQGDAPADATLVRATTNDVYVNLRVQTAGPADEAATNAVQDGFRFTPTTPVSGDGTGRVRPVADDPENYLDVVNQMLALDPPPAEEQGLLDRFRAVGVCGSECSWDELSEDVKDVWRTEFPGLGRYFERLAGDGRSSGWIDYSPPGNLLGTTEQKDYDLRAYSLATGGGMLGMSREEANYWITFTGSDDQPLLGSRDYTLHLPPGGIPSAAFWSITLYEVRDTGQFPTPNPVDRYVISSETEGLVTNPDGGIDITIRAAAPDTSGTNWLPSPADGTPFILFARSYIPESSVLAGDYTMPPVTPA
ncbi:DUF1254 domain-containing protein [Rhodococcus triatomae]|uniref:Uncharacterized conserved protein n=1 Tax=Rhodococcus triatomae TaxID=300028 RepID=A0A1G8QN94_9NOCA|nr:DUF1254 domain-containing protein [Rhodococcus triatomae]QNG20617.1 DUF1254 domain-containing protein [Rhodococcus triatomae]QNG23465.1 DUF1254 domain-containing protein [Rhodococcus triatomae]SDJ06259.1 Uncharacterized conserved protein [Rhodococcus triatomae]